MHAPNDGYTSIIYNYRRNVTNNAGSDDKQAAEMRHNILAFRFGVVHDGIKLIKEAPWGRSGGLDR